MAITNGAAPYVLSNSEIQTYKDCKRKWYLTYWRKLKPIEPKFIGPLALGSRIHEALDMHYSTGVDLLDAHTLLVQEDRKKMVTAMQDPGDLDSEAELGRIMLEGYEEWVAEEGINAEYDMISTEEVISMPLFDGAVELQGKIDMRVRRKADGVRLFRDWKTSASFSQFEEGIQLNEQILTYMTLEAAQNSNPDERSEGGIFTLFKKVKRTGTAKPPFYTQVEVRHNIFTMRSFWRRLHGEIADLMATKKALDEGVNHQQVAYPRPSRDCTWKCSFFAICPMMDDGSAVEQAISDRYAIADPYDYYLPVEHKGSDE